ncbi:Mitochondrial tRNAs modification protein [Coemansia sp. RSA 2322]|uniref:N(6)-L-threonylcarbamoyladenine synthase n=1 Tax=Coemansia thaxteri TaxID=2663907 RepID=A0A9W8BIM4_9FUNG|nr:Mitochondrial tRNAs modification protein [Coemansia thaxteri]KAJ2470729.1 Mitochondrial tRNAs modification protein [Coemansia sp. RSA 2322]KAJ2484798.1 Mitochondrial tRNAs modification protein [Coemansia sp. RSA 2320]
MLLLSQSRRWNTGATAKRLLAQARRWTADAKAGIPHSRPIVVLGIETSCDDTAAAVVTGDGCVLGETNRHQHAAHEAFGGIVPSLAASHHMASVGEVVRDALRQAGVGGSGGSGRSDGLAGIDAVAVTRGPGMAASLCVGLAAAKTLAAVHGLPLVGVHHMEAHALVARMGRGGAVAFPFLCVLVSGGHTLTAVAHGVNAYTAIGATRDDSAGDAFDKVARELRIPWLTTQDGGGPGAALERMAAAGDAARFAMPVPMDKSASAASPDFSFSGLKEHVRSLRRANAFDPAIPRDQADVAAAFQRAAATHLRKKTALAARRARDMGVAITCIVAAGGVVSNHAVRAALAAVAAAEGVPLECPPPRLCADNAVMVAWAGIERLRCGLTDAYTIDFIQRWPLEALKGTA